MKYKLFIILLFMTSLPLISANGLAIIGNSSFNISKIMNQDEYINFQLENQEPYSFFNLSFQENPWIFMNTLAELESGYYLNISAKVISNEDIDKEIRIIGYKEVPLGGSSEIYEIDVSYLNEVPNDCLL